MIVFDLKKSYFSRFQSIIRCFAYQKTQAFCILHHKLSDSNQACLIMKGQASKINKLTVYLQYFHVSLMAMLLVICYNSSSKSKHELTQLSAAFSPSEPLLSFAFHSVFINYVLYQLNIDLECDIFKRGNLYVLIINILLLPMKALILMTILALIHLSSSIVDRTYFSYLGLKISASTEEVKRAYDQKLQKIEALQNQQQKSKKLKLLKQAYDTLSNDKERQKYQRYGKDVFRTIKEMTCYDKRNPENPKDQRKSDSFKITIPVSIGDIYNGTVVKAKFPRQSACPVCQGTGAKSPKDLKPCSSCSAKGFTLRQQQNFYGQRYTAQTICPICKGSGKIVTKTCQHCRGTKLINQIQTIQIPIPKGLPNGNKFTLKNYGDQSLVGAPSDFQITIVEIPSERWSREGNNLAYLMEISLQEALFGFKKSIQHLDGSQVTVNRQNLITTKDTKHSIKERGLVNQQGLTGNLVVKFKVTIPKFTDQQLDMWEDFFYEHPM